MTAPAPGVRNSWSVLTYRLILQAYPNSFRQEFGESMVQVFGDSVRQTRMRAGIAGLPALWARTLVDVARSLPGAYALEARDSALRLTAGLGILFVLALACTVGYAAMTFGEFYQPPAFSRFGAPDADEGVLLAAYAQAMDGDFGSYRAFAVTTGFVIAVLLGAASGLFGLWQKSLAHGAAGLLAGTAVTIAAFELLPTIWFPLDRYPLGALWLLGGGLPLAVAVSGLVMGIGRLTRAPMRIHRS